MNSNQLKEKKVAFHLIQEEEKQYIEWEMDAGHLNEHYPEFERNLKKIKEDERLFYKQETNPNSTPLFEGFDDLLD